MDGYGLFFCWLDLVAASALFFFRTDEAEACEGFGETVWP
jgi:hypothetical protein